MLGAFAGGGKALNWVRLVDENCRPWQGAFGRASTALMGVAKVTRFVL